MKTEDIDAPEITGVVKEEKREMATGCCGGEPATNEEACCKLDEHKKAEGESGCGCSTSKSSSNGSGCC